MSGRPFRILALAGGGARGLFQAVYLSKLSQATGKSLSESFDLVAGTSTGAIVALAVALKVDPARIVDLFTTRAPEVFRPRLVAMVRRGPRYSESSLRTILADLYDGRRLSECHPAVLVTASSLDRFSHRIFSTLDREGNGDGSLLASDVALASAAAPTFFPPVTPAGQRRSYVDGGLWANSPVLAAVLTAHQQRGIPLQAMRVLSIGNGEFPHGSASEAFGRLRPFGIRTIQSIFEIMFATQASFADEYAMRLLPAGNFIRVNAVLNEALPLDDWKKALSTLPALAEDEFERRRRSVLDLVAIPENEPSPVRQSHGLRATEFVSNELIQAAGLSGFYPSRAFYAHRHGAASIDQYIATARNSLVMVSINLMTGVPFDGMLDVLEKKLESRETAFETTISLLDPGREHLMMSVAPALDLSSSQLIHNTFETVERLLAFRQALSDGARKRLRLRFHAAIPFGSAILLDHKAVDGRIQIETKSYKTPVRKSFAFEVLRVASEGDLYDTLSSAYERLIEDGREMDSEKQESRM